MGLCSVTQEVPSSPTHQPPRAGMIGPVRRRQSLKPWVAHQPQNRDQGSLPSVLHGSGLARVSRARLLSQCFEPSPAVPGKGIKAGAFYTPLDSCPCGGRSPGRAASGPLHRVWHLTHGLLPLCSSDLRFHWLFNFSAPTGPEQHR